MESCIAYQPSMDNAEPVEGYEAWLPISYHAWSPGNTTSYPSTDFSSPIAYSRPSYGLSYEVLGEVFNNTRSSSMVPTKCSNWSQELVTPPVTPQQYRGWSSSTTTQLTSESSADAYTHSDGFADGQILDEDDVYLPEILQLSLGQHASSKRLYYHAKGDGYHDHGIAPPFHPDANDPALSQQIFLETPRTPAWQASYTHRTSYSTPKTIAPRATIQKVLPSSSPLNVDGPTSYNTQTCTDFEYALDSSPLSVPSQAIVPSQDCFAVFDTQRKGSVTDEQPTFTRLSHQRSSRRQYLRKTLRSVADKPRKDHDDHICNEVIPANAFLCTFPGCVDKARGKPKSFKRQEHRKRHEKTLHGVNGEIFKISCWVPQCPRSFTRTDNLKSHFKTHGKNSSTSRNRYVATLDETSQFSNPHWRGELTEDGFPVVSEVKIHQCWVQGCGKIYHLQSKLKTHLLQQHGRKSSNPTASYVATLDESSDLFDPEWKGQITDDGIPIR